jgi:hypothetical protein
LEHLIEQISMLFNNTMLLISDIKVPEKVFVFHDVKRQDDCLVPLGVNHSVTQNGKYLIVRKIF